MIKRWINYLVNTQSFNNDLRLRYKGMRSKVVLLLNFLDISVITVSFWFSFIFLNSYFNNNAIVITNKEIIFSIFVILTWFMLLRFANVPKIIPRTTSQLYILFGFFRIGFIGFLLLAIIKTLLFLTTIHLVQIIIFTTLSIGLLITFRELSFSVFKYYRGKGYNLHYAIVYADGFSDEVLETLFAKKEWGIRVLMVLTDSKLIKAKFGKRVKIISPKVNLKILLQNFIIDEVIYSKKNINKEEIQYLMDTCKEIGVLFRLQSGLSPLESSLNLQIPYDVPELAYSTNSYFGSLSLIIKNISDYYVAATLLLLLSPLMAFIAIVIRLDSRGPIFFKQVRVGLRGRKFNLLKFRTMVSEAEQMRHQLEILNEMDGPVFKIKKDPRITRIGGFLRKTGLDEFPQLINVLLGQMSLIGPRPPLQSEVAFYEPWQLRRLSVKPGITCTWQVTPNRNDVKFEEWMKLDLKYIDNWTLLTDLSLFFKTIRTVMGRTGV